ncbi:MAG: glycosyltransferase [Anaerolineales bacterium]|nr:glycosyltransferase [Anaerolineales bacterium]
MRILFLAQLLPYPLDSGVKFRTYYTLRYLASRHEVTLLCFARADNTPEQVGHLEGYCSRVQTILMRRSKVRDVRYLVESMLFGRSFIIIRDTVHEMQAAVEAAVRQALMEGRPFDAIHCDQLWMAQYALSVQGIRKVIDQHNAVYLIPKRMAQHTRNPLKRLFLEYESRKLARYEAASCQKFDHILTVTDVDRDLLERLLPASHPPITSLPICLDPSDTAQVQVIDKPATILHLGTMYWPPNVDGVLWFAKDVFPLVQIQVPQAQFCVVGKNPPAAVRALGQQPGVRIAGYVEDPLPYLQESAALIVPVRAGGGMRVKIIDGWLRGIPMVSTTIGAEGIEVRAGENILIADDVVAFADAVTRLIQDRALAQSLALNGRRWAEEQYDWRKIYPALDDIYSNLGR